LIWTLVVFSAGAITLYALTHIGAARVNARYPHQGTHVDVDGVALHCVERGTPSHTRPSLVFVHGASSNHREFLIALGEHVDAHFGEDQHVIFVDRPGQGGSARRPGDHSPRVQADRILAAAHKLGAPSIIAIGHSWGGAVVAQMAVHGETVEGAVFAAPATHPWPGDRFQGVDWYYAVADAPVIGWLFTRLITLPVAWGKIDDGVENVFAPEPPKPGYAKALGARLVLRPSSFRANAEDVYRLLQFVIEHTPSYREISIPVRVITGDEDGVVWPHLHSDGLERDIENAKKIVIKGGGHMPHQTHPELLLKTISEVMEAADRATKKAESQRSESI
jgi:pimeloyl-ACP methyl ester carboxylesterase